MTCYVCGFLLDPDNQYIVLIEKQKPWFLKDKLNGVGGKIELGENCYEAMTREFLEETGVVIKDWTLFCTLSSELETDYKVYFFYCKSDLYDEVRTMEEETVGIYDIEGIMCTDNYKIQPNVLWLLGMILSFDLGERCKYFVVKEHK